MSGSRKIKLTPKERLAQSREFWVPPGTPIEVRGRTLAGGMVYAGSGIGALSVNEPVEPSAIDPTHKGAKQSRKRPSYSYGWSYTYPSYSRLTADEQGQYLDWLATGRRDDAPADFLWIFLYGLERRLMFDARQDAAAKAEIPLLVEEIERLRARYKLSEYGRFDDVATNLSHAALIRAGSPDPGELTPPDLIDRDTWTHFHHHSIGLAYVLGTCALDEQPIPAEWALYWSLAHSYWHGGPAIRRFTTEFQTLFLHAYQEEYGAGIVPVAKYTWAEKLSYSPVSPSFAGSLRIGKRELPHITEPKVSAPGLENLLRQATKELQAFSRVAGKPGNEIPATAVAALPAWMDSWNRYPAVARVASQLDALLGDRGVAVIPKSELYALFPEVGETPPPRMPKAIGVLMQRLGYQLVPDPTTESPAYLRSEMAGIYRIDPEHTGVETPDSDPTAFGLLSLLTCAAAEGGVLSEAAQDAIRAIVERHPPEDVTARRRLEASMTWQLRHPATFPEAKKHYGDPFAWDAQQVRAAIVAVLAADGAPSPLRVKELSKLYRLVGLSSEQLHSDIHRVSTMQPASDALDAHEVSLDSSRIEHVRQETDTIASMLHEIFTGDDAPVSPHDSVPNPAVNAEPIESFLQQIAEYPTWSMNDLTALAASLGLMASGAIETLNDRAIERGLEPLLDCDGEVCDCYEPTLKELLAHV